MNIKLILATIFCIIIVSLPITSVKSYNNTDSWFEKGIRIVDFQPSEMKAFGVSGQFEGHISFQNERRVPIFAKYQVDFLDENHSVIEKSSEKKMWVIPDSWGENSLPIKLWKMHSYHPYGNSSELSVSIDEWQDVDYLQISVFKKIPFFGWILCDIFEYLTLIGRQRRQRDKVRIVGVSSQEFLKENESNFTVEVEVINEGNIFQDAWIRIDLIGNPSIFPGSDVLNIERFIFARKELGRNKEENIVESGEQKKLKIDCDLREADSRKENVNIEAVLFVKIGGKHYKIGNSPVQTIYHEQPICREESCIWLFIGTIFSVLIAVLIIALIVRLIFPIFHKKSNK